MFERIKQLWEEVASDPVVLAARERQLASEQRLERLVKKVLAERDAGK